MPLEFNERPIPQINYITNSTQFVDIPRDRNIRRIVMRFVINVTTTATPPTYTEDNILNVIKKIRILQNGNDVKMNTPSRMWFYVEQYEKGTQPRFVAPTSSASTTADAEVCLIADFAQRRQDEDDISALLPARRFASLRLEIDWGGTADLATANAPTINSASRCIIEIREVTGEEEITVGNDSKVRSIDELDFIDLREAIVTQPIDSNHSSFDNDTLKSNVIPAPAIIYQQALMVRDQTAPWGVKSNALVTDIKVQKEVGRPRNILQRTFFSLFGEIKVEYQIETSVTGFIYIDWKDKLRYGLENTGNEGDVKYRFLTAGFVSGQNIDIFTRSEATPFAKLA